MKKIIQYSLYALMVCSFVDVNAAEVYRRQWDGGYLLESRSASQAEDDYINQIRAFNNLCHSGTVERIHINIDGEASAALLFRELQLPGNIAVDISIEGHEGQHLHVTSALLNAIGMFRNIGSLSIRNAVLKDGVALCNLLIRCGVKNLVLDHVNSSAILSNAEEVGGLLSRTSVEFFGQGSNSFEEIDLFVTHLPKTIKELRLEAPDIPLDKPIFRKILESYPKTEIAFRLRAVEELDLKTIAYMILHPSFSWVLHPDHIFRREIYETGIAKTEAEADAIANVLMAFWRYHIILNNPYEHVGLLMDTLTMLQNLHARLSHADAGRLVEATSRFRKAVEDKYGEFAALDKDSLNNAFRQLIQQEAQALMFRINQQGEDELRQLLPNAEEDDDVDMTEPEQLLSNEPPLKKQKEN